LLAHLDKVESRIERLLGQEEAPPALQDWWATPNWHDLSFDPILSVKLQLSLIFDISFHMKTGGPLISPTLLLSVIVKVRNFELEHKSVISFRQL
jgi:hypothetical protein